LITKKLLLSENSTRLSKFWGYSCHTR